MFTEAAQGQLSPENWSLLPRRTPKFFSISGLVQLNHGKQLFLVPGDIAVIHILQEVIQLIS